jgi:hypothetical protein
VTTVSTTPVQLNDGSAAIVHLGNTGSPGKSALISRGGVFVQTLDPGFSADIKTNGAALTAVTLSGSTEITVDITGVPPGAPGGGVAGVASVAGLSGTVSGSALSTALALPSTYARSEATAYVDNFVTDPTNATAGIVAAAATVAAGGTLIFGPKTYTHTGLTFTQNGINLRGSGRGQTVLQAAAGMTAISVDINPTGTTFKQPYSIEDMDVFGVTGSSHGIRVRYASVVNLKNVRSKFHGGDGLRFYEVTAAVINNSELTSNAGNGLTLGKKSDAITLIGTSMNLNTGWGALIGADTGEEAGGNGRVNAVTLIGCGFIGNTAGASNIRFASSNGVRFQGCYLENNGAAGAMVQLGESGGGTIAPITFSGCYFNGVGTQTIGITAWNCTVTVEDTFFENLSGGGLKMNVASTPWVWNRNIVNGGTYALQDSTGANLIQAISATNNMTNSMKFGFAAISAAADITMDRNGTEATQFLRIIQSGAGAAGNSLLAVSADGTTTTQQAAFFRSKGTGAIASFNNAALAVWNILTSGRVVLNAGPAWCSGTGSPESVVTAPIGSIYSRTDGGAATSLYVKEAGAGNVGWVAK